MIARIPIGRIKGAWLAALIVLACASAAPARDTTPTSAYYASFAAYHDGSYGDALKEFLAESRGSIKSLDGRWIDAICYHTMAGECYYQMGQYPKALEQYNAALALALKHHQWLLRVQFPTPLKPAGPGQVQACPWGRSSRHARLADVPEQMMITQGQLNNLQAFQQGGVVRPPTLFPLHVTEVVRATMLAQRRRRELMGPAGAHDSLNAELLAALARRPVPPNHWSEAWIDIQLGLAYAAIGNDGQAKGHLERGTIAAGEFDHPLTAVALIELGRIALGQNDLAAAARHFEEASYAAFQYLDPALLEEAFRYGQMTHLASGAKQPYPPLEAAANWARAKGLTQLRASLLLLAAENRAALGRTSEAADLLATARTTIGNRDMLRGRLGARLHLHQALVLYQQGKIKPGDDALGSALAFQRSGGSLWLFQTGLVDGLYVQGKVSDRVARNLYGTVLREPQRADWLADPLESLSVLVTPQPGPWEHWFEAALARKDYDGALEISELVRRHRFLSTLEMGGRLLALRWLLDGPAEAIDQQAALERQELLGRYPAYAELANRARQLRAELARLPLVPDDPTAQREQADKLAQLADVSSRQEALLRQIALRREPSKLVFPPQRSVKEIKESLAEGEALLVFFATSRRLYVSLVSRDEYPVWEAGSPAALARPIATLLREMGHHEANREVTLAELEATAWEKSARGFFDQLFKGSKSGFPRNCQELVIVPDGPLWYFPFEAVPLGDEKDGKNAGKRAAPLITRCRVRYAPTIGLAFPDGRGRKRGESTGVVVGRLFPGADEAAGQRALADLSQSVRGVAALRGPLPVASSTYAAIVDRLVVLDDLVVSENAPYDWSPLPLDRGGPGSSLAAWLSLPWAGPDQVILPGFHTPAESSLKRTSAAGPGNDVFLSVCGLMASGSRTVLISRWRTGGQTAFDLMREFVQELPYTTAADAWQRSVFVTMAAPVNPAGEPRVRLSATDVPPKASHPFFWAGYLLIDRGTPAEASDDDDPAEHVLQPVEAAKGALRQP